MNIIHKAIKVSLLKRIFMKSCVDEQEKREGHKHFLS